MEFAPLPLVLSRGGLAKKASLDLAFKGGERIGGGMFGYVRQCKFAIKVQARVLQTKTRELHALPSTVLREPP